MTRRFFIGSAASFGAFGGCRFFESHGFAAGGTPRLRFGVVSDIHITSVGKDDPLYGWGNNVTFRHALEWFRSQDVDAVMIAGDLADNGLVGQLQAVAQAWYSVFPNDRYPDGRPIEKIFALGNHDFHGYLYSSRAKEFAADPALRAQHVLRADFRRRWREILDEAYVPFFVKEVKGYPFLVTHWDDGTGVDHGYSSETFFGAALGDYLSAHGRELDPSLPFFYVQHPHLKDTCYGPWAWGHDNGVATKHLSAYPNAIAFSGHSHYSLTDERSLWQGAFTSCGAGSLRYTGLPYDERYPLGYENTRGKGTAADWRQNAAKLSGELNGEGCRQGMLWSVYDDCIVVRRREFLTDLELGPDWVMPLPAAEPKPFSFVERAKKIAAPSFAPGVKVEVVRAKAKTRGGRSGQEKMPSVEKDVLRVVVPPAVPAANARLYEVEFVLEAKDGGKRTKLLLAEGYNHAPASPKAAVTTACAFACEDLPKGEFRFVVTPMNCFHDRGTALATDWMKQDERGEA